MPLRTAEEFRRDFVFVENDGPNFHRILEFLWEPNAV